MRLVARLFAFASLVPLLVSTSAPSSHAADAPGAALAKLCEDYWQGELAASPTLATQVGDHRFDDKLEDLSPEAATRDSARLADVLARARAIDESALSPAERVTRGALIEQVGGDLAKMACHFDEWVVDPIYGPQNELLNLADEAKLETGVDAARFVERCRAMAPYLDQFVANLRRGLARGRVACESPVRKTLAELDALCAKPVADWPLMAPSRQDHADWQAGAVTAFGMQLEAALGDDVKPAFERFRDFLRNDVLPKARSNDKPGIVNMTGGLDWYRVVIRKETSLDRSPEEIHRTGLEAVANFRRELGVLGKRALGTSDVAEIQRRLRGDPKMHFKTSAEIEAKAREALARAQAAVPAWFGLQPKTPCEVKVMGAHESENGLIGYYRELALDGSRPGCYMINTTHPETRPRYEAEALAFHESVPGHHLQLAIQAELHDLPAFRRKQGVTSFVEGWALYTERLADEMGLYSNDSDRIGMLSFDAWRACRLVVDTGIHAMGWTRQQAIDYLTANTVLAPNNIANEVDRYITWPGQALAYKLGQIEILALRDEARQKLGPKFDIRAFHDVVLRNGAVALPVLRHEVEVWIESAQAAH